MTLGHWLFARGTLQSLFTAVHYLNGLNMIMKTVSFCPNLQSIKLEENGPTPGPRCEIWLKSVGALICILVFYKYSKYLAKWKERKIYLFKLTVLWVNILLVQILESKCLNVVSLKIKMNLVYIIMTSCIYNLPNTLILWSELMTICTKLGKSKALVMQSNILGW